jgi:hypothetical protein
MTTLLGVRHHVKPPGQLAWEGYAGSNVKSH